MRGTRAGVSSVLLIALVNEKHRMEIKPHFNKTTKCTWGQGRGGSMAETKVQIITEHIKILLFLS